jgi:hypothetical protein
MIYYDTFECNHALNVTVHRGALVPGMSIQHDTHTILVPNEFLYIVIPKKMVRNYS